MKALLKALTTGLLLVLPLATAHAQGPTLSPIANVSMNAGGTLSVNVVASDAQNRVIQLTSSLPPFATLNTPTIGTGLVVTTLTLVPSGAQVGDYSAAVTATAGGVSTVRVFQISVNAAGSDRAPTVVAPALQSVTSGTALSFTVTASDPDGNPILSWSAGNLPGNSTFTPNGSNTSGTFSWTPGDEDAGDYDVQFTASNALSGSSVTHLHVGAAPALAITPIADVTVAGGSFVSVPVHASGVPGASISLTAALPTFATLNPPGTGTGAVNTTITVSPPTGSAGTYHASITAISQGASVTEEFDIIVTGAGGGDNHPPVLTAPATATVAVDSTLSFLVSATDADTDHVDLFGSALPPGSSFTDHANGTGTFSWTPVAGQAGTYTASFSGLDNRGGSGSASTIITVTGDTPPANHPPTLSAPATVQVNESVHVAFTVSASDPDSDHVALSTGALPSGASFIDLGDNTGVFMWTPDTTQVGTHQIAFLGNDGQGGTGTATTIITVRDSVVPGGGGGDTTGIDTTGTAARACLVGKFKPHRETTCFRIKPVDHSFDVRNFVVSSIRLRYQGDTLAALAGARLDIFCDKDHGHHGDDDGDDDGDDGDGDGHRGAGRHGIDGNGDDDDYDDHGSGDHGDHGYDKCGVTCDDHHDHRKGCGGCDTLGVRACFSTEALIALFDQAEPAGLNHPSKKVLPCALLDAEMLATLTTGETIVATFGGNGRHRDDDHDDDDDGKIAGGDDPNSIGKRPPARNMNAQVKPNPLNPLHPNTVLSFTMPRDGRVRVGVYDMQGRLVKSLVDDFRNAGELAVAWNGTNEGGQRVPSGVYFLRIYSLEGAITRRVAVVR